MTLTSLLAFAGLCVVLSITPGPDTFLTLRISLNRASAGLATAFGCGAAGIAWAILVGLGLAAIVEQSAEVFRWIKIAGGAYLLYLAVSSLLRMRKANKLAAIKTNSTNDTTAELDPESNKESNHHRYSLFSGFSAGFLSTLLNPKVGLFYLALVPQFIPSGGDTFSTALILGSIEAIIAFSYLAVIVFISARAMKWLKKPVIAQRLEIISSTLIGGIGIGIIGSSLNS